MTSIESLVPVKFPKHTNSPPYERKCVRDNESIIDFFLPDPLQALFGQIRENVSIFDFLTFGIGFLEILFWKKSKILIKNIKNMKFLFWKKKFNQKHSKLVLEKLKKMTRNSLGKWVQPIISLKMLHQAWSTHLNGHTALGFYFGWLITIHVIETDNNDPTDVFWDQVPMLTTGWSDWHTIQADCSST